MKPATDTQPVEPIEQLELVPSPPRLSVCRTCRQTIIWTRTERDKKMPLDADPVSDHDQAGLYVLRETERRDGPLAIAAWVRKEARRVVRRLVSSRAAHGKTHSEELRDGHGSNRVAHEAMSDVWRRDGNAAEL